MVKTADDIYGITYRWNEQQTDAVLVDADGFSEDFTVTEDGQQRIQTWTYPSRADCRTCHTPAGGGALSFTTRQLNRDFDYGQGPENQLTALAAAGYFDGAIPSPATLPQFSRADDGSFSLEHRARSFLAANCVSCHQPGGLALGSWNARPELSLEESGILESLLNNDGGDPFARTVVPGDPARSAILQRLHSVATPGPLPAMPPIATSEANDEGIALLTEWIEAIEKILFVRGADRSGGFLEGGNDAERTEHLGDIENTTTGGGNHGWGELAETLRDEGFLLEQIKETAENGSGPSAGIPIDFENLNLDQYRVIVFGSNNATYDTAAIDAIDDWIRGGGSALFISDANFGGDWADASNSDQQFLDRFGLVMNQDNGTYAITRSAGEFLVPDHPVFAGVDEFHGEGVSPISIGTPPQDVYATVLAGAEGQVRRNAPPFGNENQGQTSAATSDDGALLVAGAGLGKIAGHYDRNTFFNDGGAGSDITRFDNRQYAINLFHWLAEDPIPGPTGLTATKGEHTDRIDLAWDAVTDATDYTIYRHTTDSFSSATLLLTTTDVFDSDATAVPGVEYHYWVVATVDGFGSRPSTPDTGYLGLTAATNLSATNGTRGDGVELTWTSVAGATEYRVHRATTAVFGDATVIATVAGIPYLDMGATAGILYHYWIVAASSLDTAEPSSPATGQRQAPGPGGLAATKGIHTDRVGLAWNAVVNATEYAVYRHTTSNFSSASLLLATSNEFASDNTANLGIEYHYWVVATVGGIETAPSTPDTGYLGIPSVNDLSATNDTRLDGVELTWTTVVSATEYRIYRSTTDVFEDASLVATVSDGPWLDTNATGGVPYYYWIEGANSLATAAASASASGQRRLVLLQPDLLLGNSPGKLKGNDRYNRLAGQKLKGKTKGKKPVTAIFRVQNDGNISDQVRLAGTRSSSTFKLSYQRLSPGRRNITSQVVIGGYVGTPLAPGASETSRVSAKPSGRKKGSQRIQVRAFSASDTSKRDRVQLTVVRKK